MEQTQANFFLQSLRGNQAIIVLAYLVIKRALTIEELEECTGLSNDTVRSAVKKLASKQMLYMQRGERGKQTWLPAADSFFGQLTFQNPKFPDSGSSGSLSLNTPPLPLPPLLKGSESEKIGFCLAACDEMGIREPKRSEVAKLPHVTPDFIRAHVLGAQADGVTVGGAIYRIINNWPPPDLPAAGESGHKAGGSFDDLLNIGDDDEEHDIDCECITCKREHPERFCQFKIVVPGTRATRSSGWRDWERTCDRLLEPGQKYCAEHGG